MKVLILFLIIAVGAFGDESPTFTQGFHVWQKFKAQGNENNFTPEEHDEGGFFSGAIGGVFHAMKEMNDPVSIPFKDANLGQVIDAVYGFLIKHPSALKRDYFYIVKEALQEASSPNH